MIDYRMMITYECASLCYSLSMLPWSHGCYDTSINQLNQAINHTTIALQPPCHVVPFIRILSIHPCMHPFMYASTFSHLFISLCHQPSSRYMLFLHAFHPFSTTYHSWSSSYACMHHHHNGMRSSSSTRSIYL